MTAWDDRAGSVGEGGDPIGIGFVELDAGVAVDVGRGRPCRSGGSGAPGDPRWCKGGHRIGERHKGFTVDGTWKEIAEE